MTIEVRVPTLGESVTEATIATWFKKPGEAVAVDEMLCELETDKVSVEVPSPAAGVLSEIIAKEGDTVEVNALLAMVDENATAAAAPAASASAAAAAPSAPAPAGGNGAAAQAAPSGGGRSDVSDAPAASAMMAQHGLSRDQVQGTGRDGRVMKGDVLRALQTGVTPSPAPAAEAQAPRPASAGGGRLAREAGAHDAPAPDHRPAP